jgi:purine-binding chemotaxis protein CheW
MSAQTHLEEAPARARSIRLALVYMGNDLYCLDKEIIRNVCGAHLMMKPNQGAGWLRGWLRIGAGEIPVFGLSRAVEPSSRVLILDAPDKPRGLIVDQIAGLIELEPESFYQLPPCCGASSLELFSGVASINGRFVLEIGFGSPRGRGRRPSAPPAEKGARGQALIFSTGQIRYGGLSVFFLVSLLRAVELMEPTALMRVPGSEPHFLGLAGWRGQPLPLIDLSARLGFGPSALAEDTCFLILRSNRLGAFGIPVCARLELRSLPIPNEPFGEDLGLDASLIKGAYKSGDSLLLVPDLESIGGAQ